MTKDTNIITGIVEETAGQLSDLQKEIQEMLKDALKKKVPVKEIR